MGKFIIEADCPTDLKMMLAGIGYVPAADVEPAKAYVTPADLQGAESEETKTRRRRTKEQIAADEAAKAAPLIEAESEAAAPEELPAAQAALPQNEDAAPTADINPATKLPYNAEDVRKLAQELVTSGTSGATLRKIFADVSGLPYSDAGQGSPQLKDLKQEHYAPVYHKLDLLMPLPF